MDFTCLQLNWQSVLWRSLQMQTPVSFSCICHFCQRQQHPHGFRTEGLEPFGLLMLPQPMSSQFPVKLLLSTGSPLPQHHRGQLLGRPTWLYHHKHVSPAKNLPFSIFPAHFHPHKNPQLNCQLSGDHSAYHSVLYTPWVCALVHAPADALGPHPQKGKEQLPGTVISA